MGRLFHLFPNIRVNRVFLLIFAVSLWLPMAAPRGVTYTLSDYRALGPPFPGGLHFSYYPFLEGGGSPFFPLTCLYSFQTYSFHHWGMVACNFFFVPFFFTLSFISLKSSLKRIFWPSSPAAIMGRFAVHWLKLTRACVSFALQSVWCPVPLPPPPRPVSDVVGLAITRTA